MSQFTDAEQAFIDATVPVLEAGEEQRIAYEKFEAATLHAQQVGDEQLEGRAADVEYVHSLMLAAAEQAGFGEDSIVQQALRDGLNDYRQLVAMIDAAANSSSDLAFESQL